MLAQIDGTLARHSGISTRVRLLRKINFRHANNNAVVVVVVESPQAHEDDSQQR